MQYGQGVKSSWLLARRYGFDALIALLAIEGLFELEVSRSDSVLDEIGGAERLPQA